MRVNKPTKIITHHAVSSTSHTASDVNIWHFKRFKSYSPSRLPDYPFVGYNYVIEWDGTIRKCRDLDEEGIHCKGQNFSSIGVCFMGNFDEHYPSQAQIKAWKKLYKELCDETGLALQVYPHRKYANKSCHGKLLEDDYFMTLVDREYKLKMIEKLRMFISQLQVLVTRSRMK